MNPVVEESRRHLADLIEACQRCAWHLEASAARIEWPLTPQALEQRQMDLDLFVEKGDAALYRTRRSGGHRPRDESAEETPFLRSRSAFPELFGISGLSQRPSSIEAVFSKPRFSSP
jgi:hypothetical protein